MSALVVAPAGAAPVRSHAAVQPQVRSATAPAALVVRLGGRPSR